MGFLDKLFGREPKPTAAKVDTAPAVHTSLGDSTAEKLFLGEKVEPTWDVAEKAAEDAAGISIAKAELADVDNEAAAK